MSQALPPLPQTITVSEAMTRYEVSAAALRDGRKAGLIEWTKRGREVVMFLDSADLWWKRRFAKKTGRRIQ